MVVVAILGTKGMARRAPVENRAQFGVNCGWARFGPSIEETRRSKTMGAQVLHFGDDRSHRLQVLRSEGYAVDSCVSLQQMISRLRTGQDADLVFISEAPWCTAEG